MKIQERVILQRKNSSQAAGDVINFFKVQHVEDKAFSAGG